MLKKPEYLPASQVAFEIGVSVVTLWNWRRRKKFPEPTHFKDGRIPLWTRDVVDQFKASRISPAEPVTTS